MASKRFWANFIKGTQGNRCVCDRCRGKKYDRDPNRASRLCPKCGGAGFTAVGGTKR
jgi:Zn finger protein HypA/HybF involved in hydrogenase expression